MMLKRMMMNNLVSNLSVLCMQEIMLVGEVPAPVTPVQIVQAD